MSTQCRIGMQLPNGKYKAIICHYDGYPSNIGQSLPYYDTPEKVAELVSLNIETLVVRSFQEDGKWAYKSECKHIPKGDTTFDWENHPDHYYIFESLGDLLIGKNSEDTPTLGVAHTYYYKDGQWFGHYPYYDMEPQPIDKYISYLKKYCSDGDEDIEW